MSVALWCGVALLGGVGAVARFVLDWFVSLRLGFRFPFGTLAVNVSGAFLLGLLAGAAVRGDVRLLAGTALLGSYTTFSTWMLETQRLGEEGRQGLAVANVVLSVAIGLGVVALGHAIGAQL
jgi:CrcB protein